MGRYLPTGIVKGLGVTGGTMLRTIFPDPKKPIPNPVKGADTVQYPHEKEAPPTRARASCWTSPRASASPPAS